MEALVIKMSTSPINPTGTTPVSGMNQIWINPPLTPNGPYQLPMLAGLDPNSFRVTQNGGFAILSIILPSPEPVVPPISVQVQPTQVWNESAKYPLDGNGKWTILNIPSPQNSLRLYRNGLRLAPGLDYNLIGGNIISPVNPSIWMINDEIVADYQY